MIPENETVRELSDRVDHVGLTSLTLSPTDRLPVTVLELVIL